MKDDVNDEVPNGTPKILIPSKGVLNWGGVSKSNDMLEGEHATHFKGWIKRHWMEFNLEMLIGR
jgi:hypothetical protein